MDTRDAVSAIERVRLTPKIFNTFRCSLRYPLGDRVREAFVADGVRNRFPAEYAFNVFSPFVSYALNALLVDGNNKKSFPLSPTAVFRAFSDNET